MSDTTSATDTTDAPEPDTSATDTTDWKAEAEKYRNLSRKQEERAKANAAAAKELETLKLQSMSDIEKAVAVARIEAKAETVRELGSSLVDAEVKVAAAGRTVDVDALLEGVDRSRFLNDDGRPDAKAIRAWVDRIAPAAEETGPRRVDLGQGARDPSASLGSDRAAVFGRFLQNQLNNS